MNKLNHSTLGNIVVVENVRARRVTMRVRDGVIVASIPVGMNVDELAAIIDENEKKLHTLKQKATPTLLLRCGYEKSSNGLTIRIVEHSEKSTLVRYRDNVLSIVCPHDSDYNSKELQTKIKVGLERGLKYYGKHFLPGKVNQLAKQHNIEIKEVKVTGSRSKWGSCNSKRIINLSCFSLLLPPHLLDYLILHELTHTFEMNHSPRFYAKLNQLCGGKHEMLRKELKKEKMLF